MTRPIVIRILARDFPGRVCGPTSAVSVGLQVGKGHSDVVPGDASDMTWETLAQLGRDDDGSVLARGPAIHGPKGQKFLYLAWLGSTGGPVEMFRRAKLQLDGVPAAVLDEVIATGGPLIATMGLTDACGEPVCGSVRPPRVVWSLGRCDNPRGV